MNMLDDTVKPRVSFVVIADFLPHAVNGSKLQMVLFLASSVCGFLFVWNMLGGRGNRWIDLRQIYAEEMFGPSLGPVWRSKVKATRDKTAFLDPFGSLHAVYVW